MPFRRLNYIFQANKVPAVSFNSNNVGHRSLWGNLYWVKSHCMAPFIAVNDKRMPTILADSPEWVSAEGVVLVVSFSHIIFDPSQPPTGANIEADGLTMKGMAETPGVPFCNQWHGEMQIGSCCWSLVGRFIAGRGHTRHTNTVLFWNVVTGR